MSTDAMHASVTSLTYVQLSQAMADSAAKQEDRMTAFLTAAGIAAADPTEETKASMDGAWAEYRAQGAMTRAIADEITRRLKDRNYA